MEDIRCDRYENIGEWESLPEWVEDWLLAHLMTGQVKRMLSWF
jgi:hypothetical protein